MLNVAVWLLVGAVIGGAAGLLMRGEEDSGAFANVLVGIVGALVAGWFVAPRLGFEVARPGVFGFGALAIALVGAIVLLAVLGAWRRRRRR
jgi:uncharacterized membrane protein YeaQ/YmgE (transglycosylase-associated protein family)